MQLAWKGEAHLSKDMKFVVHFLVLEEDVIITNPLFVPPSHAFIVAPVESQKRILTSIGTNFLHLRQKNHRKNSSHFDS